MTATGGTARTDFLSGTGEMGDRIRAFDWTGTPLGHIEKWPQSLKTSVGLILSSRHPMWIGWGRHRTFLYNDAYLHVLGPAKHPTALGLPASEVWAEIWDVCGPLADKVFDNAEATFMDDVRLFMDRGDFLEETFYSFSYSPIRDDDGVVSGLFCPSTDVTPKVLNGRRLATLSELAGHALAERTTSAACATIAQTLSKNADDIPFALLYLADPSGRRATLEQRVGAFGAGFAIAPSIDLEDNAHGAWPVAEVYRSGSRQIVNVKAMGGLPCGVAERPVAQAVVLPVSSRGEHLPYGVLIVGVNPCRPLDTEHFTFFELIAGQVATAVQNARAVEEERKRADMLAEIDRAKTVFFSNVSHEFRTPLTLMLGPIENLLAKPDALRAEDHEQLAMAHRNNLRLLKLVNSLLDFSRLEAGRLQASYAPTDLCALTTDLASNFRSAMQNAGLELIVDCRPLAEPVYVDGEMWEKIVLNLLSNAFKFTFKGRVTVRIQAIAGNAVLTVADTGIGLAEKELPRIFERFRRVEGARGRSYEGTGIGLALIHEYVKLHAGQISAASRLGEGTTFTVTVPLGYAHLPQERIKRADIIRNSASFRADAFAGEAVALLREEVPPPERAPAASGTRPRIVLADDNPDMREHVRRILGAEYDVVIARNGGEALDEIRRHPPDLVLSDVMMPEVDGFDLLRALRRDPGTQALPIIFLSARAGEEMRVEGLLAGADDYLVKPFTASELLARVGTHVKMSVARRQAMEREAVLRAEAEQARDQATNVLESITDAFLGMDKDWKIVYANAEAERLNGMRRDEMMGRNHWDLFPTSPTSPLFQQLTFAATEKVAVEFDNFYQPWQRWFHVKAYPAREGGVSVFYADITDRKRIEDELRQQQQLREAEGRKWRDLFFQVPAAIAVLRGPTHIYEACNDQHVRLVGRTSAEELLHKPMGEALPEIGRRTELLDRIYRTGEPVVAQEVAIHLGPVASRELYLNYVMLPTRDDDGQVNGILAHATDVTDLVRARKHVEESEKRFASAFAEAPIGMVLTTPEGRILEANQAYMDTLGYTREELISPQDSSHFTHPDDVEPTRQFYAGLRDGGADTGLLEKRYLRKDGAIMWARCSATMRRDSAGRPDQLIAIIEDVTEQKRAREALRESEARFRQLADSMPQIVTTTLPDGSVDYLNERWFAFTGLSRSADLTASWAMVMHAEDLPPAMERWQRSLETGLDYSHEYRLWDLHESRWRWFIGRALPVRGIDGNIVKWLGTSTDIDDQKRVEEELRRANQDLEQFAYSASHDLQEPLRSIKIYGDLLKRRYRHKLDGQALEFCDYMHSGATRMEMLVTDLLAYTQVTRLEAPVEDTDANESLDAAVANLSRAIAESGAEITHDPLPSARVHSTHMRQLFQNLIGNAIKYRSPDRVPLIHVQSERQQGLWVFAVRDNGIGIETEYKEHIFGLFKRLHTSDEYSGTGIGLAICQRIVERYHGRIWVESSPGDGSTFFFSIPV
jgi:PAS domain S-box-containing protein